jgi:hypothetical protein
MMLKAKFSRTPIEISMFKMHKVYLRFAGPPLYDIH